MIVSNAANILIRAGRFQEATKLVYLVDKYHEHYPNHVQVLYTSAVGVLHAANYRAAEVFLSQAALLEIDEEYRKELRKTIRHIACYNVLAVIFIIPKFLLVLQGWNLAEVARKIPKKLCFGFQIVVQIFNLLRLVI